MIAHANTRAQQTSARLKNKTVRWRTTRYFDSFFLCFDRGAERDWAKGAMHLFWPRPQQTRTDESCDESKCTTAPDLHVLGHSLVIGTTTIASTYACTLHVIPLQPWLSNGRRQSHCWRPTMEQEQQKYCIYTTGLSTSINKKKKRATSYCIDAKDSAAVAGFARLRRDEQKQERTTIQSHADGRQRSFPFFYILL